MVYEIENDNKKIVLFELLFNPSYHRAKTQFSNFIFLRTQGTLCCNGV